jgi:hypothetical protein
MCTRVMYSLFNDAVSISDCVVLNDRMNNELVRMQKEATTVYFESKHLFRGTEENHFIPCRTAYSPYLPLFNYSTISDLSHCQLLHFFQGQHKLLLFSVLLFVSSDLIFRPISG